MDTIDIIPFDKEDAIRMMRDKIKRIKCHNCNHQISYSGIGISQRQEEAFINTLVKMNRSVDIVFKEVEKIMGVGFCDKVFKKRINDIYDNIRRPGLKLLDNEDRNY